MEVKLALGKISFELPALVVRETSHVHWTMCKRPEYHSAKQVPVPWSFGEMAGVGPALAGAA
jgi:hypothetical protein